MSYHRLFPPPRFQVCPVTYTVVSRPALRLGAENCRLIRGVRLTVLVNMALRLESLQISGGVTIVGV